MRRIAANLGLNKDTVTRHLRALRDYGFVLQEEDRDTGSGRYGSCRYVLDPSACVERFTHTPFAGETRRSAPCPKNPDTVPAAPPVTVSEEAGHGGAGHGCTGHGEAGHVCRDVDVEVEVQEEHQQQRPGAGRATATGPAEGLQERLIALGVTAPVAADLLTRHPAERVTDVVVAAGAQALRKPAGWVVAALREGWDVTQILTAHRAARARQEREADVADAARQAARVRLARAETAARWDRAVSAALDDDQLADALAQVTTPAPGMGRRSVPLARVQLLAWAVAVHHAAPAEDLAGALDAALRAGAAPVPGGLEEDLPHPPPASAPAAGLNDRIRACLDGRGVPVPAGASTCAPTPTRQEQP